MSSAFYIVLENETPSFNHGVNGKALARAADTLDDLAKKAAVQPLMQFFSASPEELSGFLEEHGADTQEATAKLKPEQWFEAEAGLQTIGALKQGLGNQGTAKAKQILAELDELQKVLETAKTKGVRWHLAVDF
jgi:hypothetical protein